MDSSSSSGNNNNNNNSNNNNNNTIIMIWTEKPYLWFRIYVKSGSLSRIEVSIEVSL